MAGFNSTDPQELAKAAIERTQRLARLREEMTGLRGHGESGDGRVSVICAPNDPLAELRIDPRAMRLGSEELSSAVRAAARAARQDLDAQVQRLTEAEYGTDTDPLAALRNADQLMASLKETQHMFEKAGRDSQLMMSELKRRFG
ncbi:YbaB/EbfC family nucleoid-associated protein [Actinomadura parmotrematis]|uniref:YbaB/EbfC family nucleoid-associated protein n=1 Tax=Actinomadura parmotrematis TaxID=2864039 RepID=A0ABS7FXW1_9ACTN|nr:YbaB/EbfC family nucleoid-associated protein [Actinomadura parmotrematis]MBW8485269.1 YbaB/EbfC family nucleoid-associated protein [Actinomadura parmotrematis]